MVATENTCSSCNAAISENDKFCPNCGEEFELEAVKQQTNIQGIITIGLLAIIVFLLLLPHLSTKNPVYEYKIVGVEDLSFDRDMKALGKAGWELIFARRATNSDDDTANYEAIFKRTAR